LVFGGQLDFGVGNGILECFKHPLSILRTHPFHRIIHHKLLQHVLPPALIITLSRPLLLLLAAEERVHYFSGGQTRFESQLTNENGDYYQHHNSHIEY
jgi:hypothetical protein